MQNLIGVRFSLLMIAFISLFLSFSFVFAQDGTSGAAGTAGADGSVVTPPPTGMPPRPGMPGPRPIDQFRKEKQGLMQEKKEVLGELKDVRTGTKQKVIELREDTKMMMKNASSGPERKDIMKGHIEERKDIRDARKASTTPLRGQLKELAKKHLKLAGERFRKALEHLQKLEERMQNRIAKLKAEGVDTATAEDALTVASTAIDKAEADAKAVKDYVDSVAEGSDPKTVREAVASLVKTANASLKAAHEALRKALEALKALQKPEESSTTDTN